ncbi:MAG: hypothetical protein OEM79_03120 [Nitrosopumilus sp.]|nr:hypothetical protein [Nitrosopumilus sp.]
MLQDKKDAIIVRFLSIMKESLVLVAIDNCDVYLEAGKVKKGTLSKLFPRIIPERKSAYL